MYAHLTDPFPISVTMMSNGPLQLLGHSNMTRMNPSLDKWTKDRQWNWILGQFMSVSGTVLSCGMGKGSSTGLMVAYMKGIGMKIRRTAVDA
jgi:hypothetical protein